MTLRSSAGVGAVSALLALLVASAGAAPLLDQDAQARPAVRATHTVLALGDSVPAGAACGCRPFPETYGSLLSKHTGEPVTVRNRAVSGLDTTELISQLHTSAVEDDVRRADIVLVTIGANDFADHHDQVVDGECTTSDTDCVSDELTALRGHLTAVLARIRELRAGRPTSVLVTGYWNVFEDGDVARHAYGSAGLQASLRLTTRANSVISSVTSAAGARFVDLFRAFQEPRRDTTSLMAADGDHPDAAGHELIARALLGAGLPLSS